MQEVLARLGIGIHSPVFTLNAVCCGSDLQQALWSSYVLHRREGLCPLHVRKSKSHTVRVYQFQGYVVKEYSCSSSKLTCEVAVLQQLQHEGLVSYLFLADEGARCSVFMDWAGQSLRTVVEQQQQRHTQLGEDAARYITFQLTDSLAYMHNQGIVHRDIKPDNIGMQPDFTVRLFDWGEALLLSQLEGLTDKQLAKVAGIAGTPLHMPPEVLLYLTNTSSTSSNGGSAHASSAHDSCGSSSSSSCCSGSPAACSCWGRQGSSASCAQQHPGTLRGLTTPKLDVWGLGTVVYFLLAGRDVLQDDSSYDLRDMAELLNASSGIKLPAKTQASPAARDFLARALERNPAKRATAQQLLQHPWLSGLSTTAAAAAADEERPGMSARDQQCKLALALNPALSLSLSRSSEGQAAYVIAAHHGMLPRGGSSSSSIPDTPVSGATAEVLTEISEFDE